MQHIQYIGKKPFTDRLYQSNLRFDVGQVRSVPFELARKFLRHQDLFVAFVEADDDTDATADVTDNAEDTDALLAEAEAVKDTTQQEQDALHDLYTQVSVMDKDALEQFARDKYQYELNKRKSLDNLRAEVIGLIDQFGAL